MAPCSQIAWATIRLFLLDGDLKLDRPIAFLEATVLDLHHAAGAIGDACDCLRFCFCHSGRGDRPATTQPTGGVTFDDKALTREVYDVAFKSKYLEA